MLSMLASAYTKWKEGREFSEFLPGELGLLHDFGVIPKHIKVLIEKIDDRFIMPTYSDVGDAGMDVYACLFDGDPEKEGKPIDEIHLFPQQTALVCVGFKVGLPDGYFLDVRPRSGISLNTPLRIANAPGTIDAGYKNVVNVIVTNTSVGQYAPVSYHCSEKGNKHGIYVIRTGDKICQLVPHKIIKLNLEYGDIHSVGSDRGGGFGRSGV